MKSKKQILLKIKIRNFIKEQLPVHILVIGSIALCAWLFNRPIQSIMFYIAHFCIRKAFDKQFHFNKTAYCISLTLAIFWFAIPITLPLTESLLSSIPIAFLICFFGFLAQDRIDLIIENKETEQQIEILLTDLKKYKQIDLFNMSEEELRNYAKSCGLSEQICDTLILKVIYNYRWVDIQHVRKYTKDGIRYHKEQIMKKLEVKL